MKQLWFVIDSITTDETTTEIERKDRGKITRSEANSEIKGFFQNLHRNSNNPTKNMFIINH